MVVFILALLGVALGAQDTNSLTNYFVGKEVVMKLDMPGTQQGVNLSFNKDNPMNWKEYSSRLKTFGVAIHKGDTVRITAFNVKKDRIEFQLDGGGFGTFFDDSSTTVSPQTVDKSDYEKTLERQLASTTDPDKRRQLQRDLDRERARRERQNQDNRAAATVASQIKAQQVADKRLQGGSRFNLRWQGSIPEDQQTPEAIMKLMADYVTFSATQPEASAPPAPAQSADPGIPATAHLKRGMKMEDVGNLLGQGKQLSQSVSADGLKTQVIEYTTEGRIVDVTYVQGVVVRYTIASE